MLDGCYSDQKDVYILANYNKILVSTSSFGKDDRSPLEYIKQYAEVSLNPYGRQITTKEFVSLAKDCDGVIAGTEKITKDALSKLPKLRVLSRMGAGIDNVDLNAVEEFRIKFYYTPDAPTIPVAELTISFILDLLKKTSIMSEELKKGVWKKHSGNLLFEKNIAIVGFGRIGQKVAKMLSGFDTKVKYYDIAEINCEYEREPNFEKLLKWADIITLHCLPLGDTPIIAKEQIEIMKNTALLINTARGVLVDENSLYEALKANKIGGAAVDVFNNEPYSGKLCNKELTNLIVTPHIASSAVEARVRMEMEAAQNCVEGLQ